MDPEDLLELGGLGLLFGGFEIVETLLAVVAVLAVVALLAGAILLLDLEILTILVVLALMIGSAVAGGLAGMKVERARGKFLD